MRFTHLHVASAFSARYGTASPETLVAAAAEQGADAAAITDRDGLYGAIRHVRACIAAGIDPIVGAELQFRTSGDQMRDIVVLAHGRTAGAGWAALSRVVSASHGASRGIAKMQNGAAHRSAHLTPSRVSAVLHGDGPPNTTVLLGPGSDVGFALQHRRVAEARQLLDRWRALLPGGVMLEVVCHHTHPDKAGSLRHAADMLSLARASGTPAVLTNRVRYLTPDDAVTGDVLDAAGQLAALGTFQPQPNAQGWLKPPKKMHLIAKSIAEQAGLGQQAASDLLSTTERLADTCRLDPDADLRWRKPKVPEASVIGIDGDPTLALWQKCEVAIGERYPDASHTLHTRIRDRLRLELGTIEHFGFETYFLTVADVVSLIRERGIRAQARGSGASSIVNYLLRVSSVDPLEHDLLFERFLGHSRSTLPDIDVDVESARRHEIYRAIFERYGDTRVTLLSMQNRYRARGASRDAGLALGIEPEQIEQIAKNIWRFNARDFREVLDQKPELREIAELIRHDKRLDLMVDLTERLDRLPRHISMHPCGVILSDNSLLSVTPVQPTGIGLPMSQFDKDDVDDIGLIKLDVLGVRMQSSIAHAVGEIARVHGSATARAGQLPVDAPYISPEGMIDVDALPHDDEPTFEAIRSAHTLGMFQIESPGQRELIGKMQPDRYEDLIADISLFRPGPMKGNMVAPYVDTKLGFQEPDYLHPRFKWFLQDSYGVVIYHEHVLRILHDCMGIDLADADELRRSMERDVDSIEDAFRTRTAQRVDERGRRLFTDREIDRIWTTLRGFGSFGFCKAHGAAFALPTYQSAWLKTHYPAEFMAGLFEHDPGMYPRRLLMAEARRIGVPLLPLDVNVSTDSYVVEWADADTDAEAPTRGIRLAFRDVQGITQAEIRRIIAERTDEPYESIADFYTRARPSRPLIQRLAAVGALDSLVVGDRRGDVIAYVRQLTAKHRPKSDSENQLPLARLDELPTGTPAPSRDEQLAAQLDVLSSELDGHVLDPYREMLDELGVTPADQLVDLRGGSEVIVAGIRVATQTPPMRSGKRVVFISFDDGHGVADCTFFDDAQQRVGPLLFGTKLMVVHGRTRRTGARGVSVQADNAFDLKQLWAQWRESRAA
ncbi:DNA polymerase III subunit alpha [Agrococcus casei]|uniref:DNA polymerase III subunit alpha n=1 Tax=Agrococcus casei TaxID=343512 RepID=UPI003F8E4B83